MKIPATAAATRTAAAAKGLLGAAAGPFPTGPGGRPYEPPARRCRLARGRCRHGGLCRRHGGLCRAEVASAAGAVPSAAGAVASAAGAVASAAGAMFAGGSKRTGGTAPTTGAGSRCGVRSRVAAGVSNASKDMLRLGSRIRYASTSPSPWDAGGEEAAAAWAPDGSAPAPWHAGRVRRCERPRVAPADPWPSSGRARRRPPPGEACRPLPGEQRRRPRGRLVGTVQDVHEAASGPRPVTSVTSVDPSE